MSKNDEFISKLKYEYAKLEGEYKDVAARVIELNKEYDKCALYYSSLVYDEDAHMYDRYAPLNIVGDQIEALTTYKTLIYDRLDDINSRIRYRSKLIDEENVND